MNFLGLFDDSSRMEVDQKEAENYLAILHPELMSKEELLSELMQVII